MQVDMHIALRSDPRLMRSVRGLIRAHFEQFGFVEDKVDEIVLAVDEACTNVIRHAYEGRMDETMQVELRSNAAWAEVAVIDEGRPAPKEKVERRELETPDIASLTPHGLGVQWMYQVFDEVIFEPGEERGNRATMRLRLPENGRD